MQHGEARSALRRSRGSRERCCEQAARRSRGNCMSGQAEGSRGHGAEANGRAAANSAKRIRAHDGCLGIRRLRRTRKTATSSGEPSTGFDPEVSEWGNPAALTGGHRWMNQIVRRSDTRGSETSQYPQEKRSNDIARVAASESAGAQTGRLAVRGCGTRTRYRKG